MIYLVYLGLIPINLLLTLVAVVLAPVLPIFAQQKDGWLNNHSIWGIGPRLPAWLNWFQTPDNSLDGDATFQAINGISYWSKVKWLWRNPAYSFALRYIASPYTISVAGDNSIKDNDNAKAGWCLVHANGLFQFTSVTPIGFNRCIYCVFGWNIRGVVTTQETVWQATFAFSPRISGFR
jgi:hypothetical protein